MEKIKSYTDIEQSKKLSKILPIQSADFSWRASFNGETNEWEYNFVPTPHYLQSYIGEPCWSLAALLDILQKTAYFIDEDANVMLCSYKTIEWDLGIDNSDLELITEVNQVDACVEMIIKLHELSLL